MSNYLCELKDYCTERVAREMSIFQNYKIVGLLKMTARDNADFSVILCWANCYYVNKTYMYKTYLIQNITDEDAIIIALQEQIVSVRKVPDNAHECTYIHDVSDSVFAYDAYKNIPLDL